MSNLSNSETTAHVLLPSQLKMREFCRRLIGRDSPASSHNESPEIFSNSPFEVEQNLRDIGFGDLLVPYGALLLPVLAVRAGKAALAKVGVQAQEWTPPVKNTDQTTPAWVHQLTFNFHYEQGGQTAVQGLWLQASSLEPGQLPNAMRDVSTSPSFDGENQAARYCHDDAEALGFIALAEELVSSAA